MVSDTLLTFQDAQAKLQYGDILKISDIACNYSLLTESGIKFEIW